MVEEDSLIQTWNGFRQWNCFSGKAVAAFTEKQFTYSNFHLFVRSIGFPSDSLQRVKQVHGEQIQIIRTEPAVSPEGICEADGLVTSRRGLLLGILTADCLPVFFEDSKKSVVGVVHAGWRGLYKQILPRTVKTFTTDFSSSVQDLTVAIGPAIRDCCYETGMEFRDYFPGFYRESNTNDGKLMVNLPAAAKAQLEKCGIPEERIYDSGICTACCHDSFFSARKGAKKDRILSVIGLR